MHRRGRETTATKVAAFYILCISTFTINRMLMLNHFGRGLPSSNARNLRATLAHQPLVDRPTQLICIWIFICWVGGGDPCGAADFCFSCLYCQKKQARSNFFSKYPCHVHNECLEIKKRRTILGKILQKTCLFQASQPPGQPKSRIPEMSQLKSGIPETSRLKSGILESKLFSTCLQELLCLCKCFLWY